MSRTALNHAAARATARLPREGREKVITVATAWQRCHGPRIGIVSFRRCWIHCKSPHGRSGRWQVCLLLLRRRRRRLRVWQQRGTVSRERRRAPRLLKRICLQRNRTPAVRLWLEVVGRRGMARLRLRLLRRRLSGYPRNTQRHGSIESFVRLIIRDVALHRGW